MAMRASPLACSLCLRSRSRHRHSSLRILGGVAAGNALQSGSARSTAAKISVTDSPENARRPTNVSYSTAPNAQMSVRLSTLFPLACSGLMYATEPRMMPPCVSDSVAVGASEGSFAADAASTSFAKPKSSTLTSPAGVTIILAGFKSRWMIPFS